MHVLEWMQIAPVMYNEISEAKPKCHNDAIIIRLTHELAYLAAALMQG